MENVQSKFKKLGGLALVIIGLACSYPMLTKLYGYSITGEIGYFYSKGGDFILGKGLQFSGSEALIMNIAMLTTGIALIIYGAREIYNASKLDKSA